MPWDFSNFLSLDLILLIFVDRLLSVGPLVLVLAVGLAFILNLLHIRNLILLVSVHLIFHVNKTLNQDLLVNFIFNRFHFLNCDRSELFDVCQLYAPF